VRLVAQQIGRAERGDDTAGLHYGEIHVALRPLSGSQAKIAEDEVRDALEKYPGASFATKTFLTERMEVVVSGARARVIIQVFGDDLDVLDQKGQEIVQVVSRIRGAVDTRIESPPGTPQMVVRLQPTALLQFGFQPGMCSTPCRPLTRERPSDRRTRATACSTSWACSIQAFVNGPMPLGRSCCRTQKACACP
jgi:Cu/Ag efflux pump CusA